MLGVVEGEMGSSHRIVLGYFLVYGSNEHNRAEGVQVYLPRAVA